MLKGIVVAGNYQEYQDWIRETGKSQREFRYVFDESQIRGLHDVEVWYTGQCYKNPLFNSDYLIMLRGIKEGR